MTKQLGVCGVVTAPDGQVVATYSDFERSGYGGMSLVEAQRYRAREGLKREFLRRYLFEGLASKSDGYFTNLFWENAERNGYRMETIVISYGESE